MEVTRKNLQVVILSNWCFEVLSSKAIKTILKQMKMVVKEK